MRFNSLDSTPARPQAQNGMPRVSEQTGGRLDGREQLLLEASGQSSVYLTLYYFLSISSQEPSTDIVFSFDYTISCLVCICEMIG